MDQELDVKFTLDTTILLGRIQQYGSIEVLNQLAMSFEQETDATIRYTSKFLYALVLGLYIQQPTADPFEIQTIEERIISVNHSKRSNRTNRRTNRNPTKPSWRTSDDSGGS